MAPPSHGLQDEIVIWEILVRLPPKALLRCHAVSRAWRRAASTYEFLLAHHDHQPSLHLLTRSAYKNDVGGSLDIIPYDHQVGVADADQLRSIAPFGSNDGLMLRPRATASSSCATTTCNSSPATRSLYACYVFTLGSDQPPRHVAWPPPPERDLVCFNDDALLFRGSLHWRPVMRGSANMIVAFDTIAEKFRLMHAPVARAHAQLFEMDGMSSFNDVASVVDIWMMQDYECNVWTFKCQVKLPVADMEVQCGKVNPWNVIIVPRDGMSPMLVQFDKWLLQVDLDGRLVARFLRERLFLTQYRLKQTLVSHSFFPKLDGYTVNGSPFM
uniref:Uncharacterized protein n=1 Tax=Avena sativa TaxID=4498 RepID=A0ACD5WRC3_AVESA